MKWESTLDARKVFEFMPHKNAIAWTSLLGECLQRGLPDRVLDSFFRMQIEGVKPNPWTFATALASSAAQCASEKGQLFHALLIKFGQESSVFVCNSLMNMYSKCGLINDTKLVFRSMECRDSVSWNSMMAGLVSNGLFGEALQLFFCMRTAGVNPTQSSFVTAIKVCSDLKDLTFARQLHSCVAKEGHGLDGNIMTALLVAYIKCGEMDKAFVLFTSVAGVRNVVSFTALLGGCIQNGNDHKAAALFSQMRKEGVEPNEFTYSTILTASPLITPSQIHSLLVKTRHESFSTVGTALFDTYAKIGNTRDALLVFREIDDKDVVAWSAMLACYAQAGDTEGCINLFMEMAKDGVVPNEFTLSSIINVCASATAAVDQGRQFHAVSIKLRLQDAICVSSALLTMYSKKGNIETAYDVFNRQATRDLVSWNSMISGFAQHGHGKRALEVFRDMETQGLEIDDITFIGVIMACTHTGLVEEGRKYFHLMVQDHRICPTMEIYAGMVDLYGRAGKLEEAMKVIKGMPFEADAMVWRVLLGSCRLHRNAELGEVAAEKLMGLEPQDSAAYVLLSNIYAAAGLWEKRARVRKLMDERKVKKEAGRSWIQVKNKVHAFVASDTSHPLTEQMYRKVKEMSWRLKEKGYLPDTSFVLQDTDGEHKQALLAYHSERLALAFGLMATAPGTPLQIVKNLRVCGDCHAVFKLVSEIEAREIVVRDSNRFHHFKNGSCSCGDFW